MLTDAQILLLGREAGLLFTRKENIIFARAIEAAVIEAGASGAAQDAKRYQWLRTLWPQTILEEMLDKMPGRHPQAELDAAIDEAVEAQQRGSGT